jgi:hypothetical protein
MFPQILRKETESNHKKSIGLAKTFKILFSKKFEIILNNHYCNDSFPSVIEQRFLLKNLEKL